MIPRDTSHEPPIPGRQRQLLGGENETHRVFVVGLPSDRIADIVEQAGTPKQAPLLVPQSVHGSQTVEQHQGKPSHVSRVNEIDVGPHKGPLDLFG